MEETEEVNIPESPPEHEGEKPPDDASEKPPDEATDNPPEEAAENPPEEAAENPSEGAAENPPEEEEREAADAEITAAAGDDSATELPTALQNDGQEDDAPFPEALGVQYGDESEDRQSEDMAAVMDVGDRPPPMAPPPAIFYREDASDILEATALSSEFMDEPTEKKEVKRPEPAVPVEKKKPERVQKAPKARATYPFRAHARTDAQISAAMRKVPPRHEYCGFIYSSLSQRPLGGYTNYFLPVYRQPRPKQHVQIAGLSVPSDRFPINKELPRDLLPLSTVKVMWSCNRTRTVYKPEAIYAYMSRFGPIDAVYPKSVNSAYVIFSDLEAAKACIQCSDLGRPWDPLIAFWAEPRMYNSGFYYKYATAEQLPTRVRM